MNGAENFISGNLQFLQKLNRGGSESPMTGMEDFSLTKTHSESGHRGRGESARNCSATIS